MAPSAEYMNEQAAQQLLQGMNTMQMRAGLMPGAASMAPPMMQPMMPPNMMQQNAAQQLSQRHMQEQQMISSFVSPPPVMGGGVSPMSRPGGMTSGMYMPGLNLPNPQFGTGRMMQRQTVQGETNQALAGVQSAAGVAARLGANIGLGMLGGPIGIGAGLAFEASGMGQGLQNMTSRVMDPLIQHREQALSLQNMSMRSVRGAGGDVSSSGVGLSTSAASRLSSSLTNMANSEGFQQQTGERFNRQDVMKITQLSGQMGMLEQSQSADQIKQQVSKISRALHNFMKIAEEPDVQNAMKMMGQLRQAGFTAPETQVAMQNARTFARMAGTSTSGVVRQAASTGDMFQQMGMSQASGINAGMAAAGAAGALAPHLTPGQLAVRGGQQGIQQALAGGMARTATNDVFLTSTLTRRNGELAVDPSALLETMDPNMSMQDVARRAGSNVRQLGGRRFASEFATQQNQLRDEMQKMLGPEGQQMMTLIRGQQMARSIGTDLGGGLRAMGLSQEESRAALDLFNSPEAQQDMRRQIERRRIDQRQDITAERRISEERVNSRVTQRIIGTGIGVAARTLGTMFGGGAGMPGVEGLLGNTNALQRAHSVERVGRRFGTAMDRYSALAGEREDIEEEVATQGGDLIASARKSRYGTQTDRRQMRDRIRRMDRKQLDDFFKDPDTSGMGKEVSAEVRAAQAAEGGGERLGATLEDAGGSGNLTDRIMGRVASSFVGTEGFGFTEAQRGGLTERQLVRRHEGLAETARYWMGGKGPTEERVQQRIKSMKKTGRILEFTKKASLREKVALSNKLRETLPKDVKKEDFDDMSSTASANFNAYLESKITMGVRTGKVDIEEFKAQERARLSAEGRSPAEIDAVLSDESLQDIADLGSATRSPEAEEAAAAGVQGGGEGLAKERMDRTNKIRKDAEALQTGALETLGVDTGLFGVSDEARKAVLRTVAGSTKGPDAKKTKAKRLLLQRNALAAAAKLATGEEKAKLEKQAASLGRQVRALGPEAEGYATQEVAKAFEGVDDKEDVLIDLADKMKGKTQEEIDAMMGGAGDAAAAAQRQTARQGLGKLFGEDNAELFKSKGTLGALSDLLEREKISDPRMRKLAEKAVAGSDAALKEIITSAESAGGHEGEATAADGLTQAGQERGFLDQMMDSAFGGGVGSRGGAPMGTGFAEAVPKFSEASDKLLEAAKNLESEGMMTGLRSIVTGGSPLSFLPGLGFLGGD